MTLSFAIIGGSGDLAQRKIFPALYTLYCQGVLPEQFCVVAFARSDYSDESFKEKISVCLKEHSSKTGSDQERTEFLKRCFYNRGNYDDSDSYITLNEKIKSNIGDGFNMIFYMAIPPAIFLKSAQAIRTSGIIDETEAAGNWCRVVLEKPFGEDRESADQLGVEIAKVFTEEQIYRIDHYLGKEVIQNLQVLRFANLIFEPVFNNNYVDKVLISWKETIGVEDRGGYFDQYGVIRDVVQNHLLQILTLVAMEQPVRLEAEYIHQEKVKVLEAIPPVQSEDIVIGQYIGVEKDGDKKPSYLDTKGVPEDSLTPTYFHGKIRVVNRRWDGVPFIIEAGKALNGHKTEIRIVFKDVPGDIFRDKSTRLVANELVIRIQPDEAIYLIINNKIPGLEMSVIETDLNFQYSDAFKIIPDAYAALLLDVINSNKSRFIKMDELALSWDIFTPLLHELENKKVKPEPYLFGSSGPDIK